MFSFLSLIFALQAQDLAVEVGHPLHAEITDSSKTIHTIVLDENYTDAPTIGISINFKAPSSGPFYATLKSYAFDSYLVLLDSAGNLLGEDDDGLYGSQSQISTEFQENQSYQFIACALHGARGPFEFTIHQGTAKQLTAVQKSEANVADSLARIEYLKSTFGEQSLEVATALENLAFSSYNQGLFKEALNLFQQSLLIWEEVRGPEHKDTMLALSNYGSLLHAQGEYKKARPILERVLRFRQKTLDPNDIGIAISMNNLAGLLQAQGNYFAARPIFEEVLGMMKKIFPADHPNVGLALNNLASLLQAQGFYSEALPMFKQTLVIWEKAYGPSHRRTATCINNLALLLQIQGRHSEARPLFERSLTIHENEFGPEHSETALALNNLALLLEAQGNYEAARPYFERALAIWESLHGTMHKDVASGLNNLSAMLKSQGKYAEAQEYMERSLSIWEEILGPEHPGAITALDNLAILHKKQGHYDKALPMLKRAVASWEKVLGPEHPDTAKSLNSLAHTLRVRGDYSKARGHYLKVLDILSKAFGEGHPKTATAIRNLAYLAQEQGDLKAALPLFQRSTSLTLQFLHRELPSMSEPERFMLLEIQGNPESYLSCLADLQTEIGLDHYSPFFQWKGNATRLQAAGIKLKQGGESEKVRQQFGELQVASKDLADLVMLPIAAQKEDHSEEIASLRKRRIRLEREINQMIDLDEAMAIPSLQDVQAGMPKDSVLLDFFVGESVYAWVLPADGSPNFIRLGSAQKLKLAQEKALQSTAIRGGRTPSGSNSSTLLKYAEMLWGPLMENVAAAKTIFVCPDGFLCELPFGILQNEDASFLLEKFQFTYLTDPSRLAQPSDSSAKISGSLLAVGDINFFQRDEVPRSMDDELLLRARIGEVWESLTGTKVELQFIRDLHQHMLKWETPLTVIQGSAATEERISEELVGKRYVHIATHGYFEPEYLPSLLLDAMEKQSQAKIGEQVKVVGLLPGLLSGLVFAGVNGDPDPTRDDGYLSAEEIQHLDLSACELVVLSACETALGSARAGEGLMSLRRAFSVAGADSIVSSLWKVDDIATAQLMKDFYINLWQKEMSRGEALHQAKLRMLRRNRIENSGNARPSTWGAFVLSGTWN